MTHDDLGEERDPLLVRPYILGAVRDDPAAGHDPASQTAPQTWPSAVPEARPRRVPDGADDPTAILTVPAGAIRWTPRRRKLALAGVGGVVVLGAAAAGFSALRADLAPTGPHALPQEPLPAVTGPQTTPESAAPGLLLAPAPAQPGGSVSGTTTSAASAAAAGSAAPSSPVASGADFGPAAAGDTTLDPSTTGPELVAPEPAPGRTGAIRGQNGLCLDLAGDDRVQMSGCAGTATQTWTLAADGTLRASGECALIAGDTTVHIAGCSGTGAAEWQVSGQLLMSAATKGCLTDPSGGSRPGTTVTVAACTGSAKQRWSLP